MPGEEEGQKCGDLETPTPHHPGTQRPWPRWCSEEELRRLTQELGAHGAMAYTTVVGAHRGRPLGERYAAVCAAMAMGERIREGGAHALVVLDDISCMVRGAGGVAVFRAALLASGPCSEAAQKGGHFWCWTVLAP